MKVRLIFDTKMFKENNRQVVERYFKGEVRAAEACRLLGWKRDQWNRHLSGIFSIGMSNEFPSVKVEVVEE